jgi:excisionase family DNA binding protein
MEPLLNMDEAAALLKLTKDQLYHLCRTRSRVRQSVPIPFIKVGKVRRFKASSLAAWVAELEKQATV